MKLELSRLRSRGLGTWMDFWVGSIKVAIEPHTAHIREDASRKVGSI